MHQRLFCLLGLLLLVLPMSAMGDTPLWTDVDEVQFRATGTRDIVPEHYRTVALDLDSLQSMLDEAPLAGTALALVSESILTLPKPHGGFTRFRIVEAPMMEPELAARFPEIRTFRGQGLDEPAATIRFDVTSQGFHAMTLGPSGSIWIDPYQRGDRENYVVYYRHEYSSQGPEWSCGVHTEAPTAKTLGNNLPSHDGELRTYRAAVAATGEYTTFHGGTVPLGQAAIVTAMNRVNGIYERDVALTMTLVANNSLVVYTNPATDPYTNNNPGLLLSQNQTNLDLVIGTANYDIGHVFSTGGGGLASLGVVCNANSKARGETGLNSPIGDVFYVDFVAHEMGHQWRGNHTFNGSSGNCSGGNRNPSTAYEPGSGSTVMAYAGICGSQNIQNFSDDYFHTESLREILNYSLTGNGDSCDVSTPTGNTQPTADAGPSYTIPISTPFVLCGTSTDPDSDPGLTFTWEQYNLGPAGHPNSPVGNAPIFRTFDPVVSPCRTFPQVSDLLTGSQTIGEILPSYARTLTFRFTARDNVAGGGAVNTAEVDIVVSDVGGPFLLNIPNGSNHWSHNASVNVAWDVAGTDQAPINCPLVDIDLSTDGGLTFSTSLLIDTANDGNASVTVPVITTSTARIRVTCASNIFFDISDDNFEIGDFALFSDGFESGNTSAWSVTQP